MWLVPVDTYYTRTEKVKKYNSGVEYRPNKCKSPDFNHPHQNNESNCNNNTTLLVYFSFKNVFSETDEKLLQITLFLVLQNTLLSCLMEDNYILCLLCCYILN